MKNIAMFGLICSLLTTVAHAEVEGKSEKMSSLYNVETTYSQKFESGAVTIDMKNSEILVNLYAKPNCPSGAACPAVMISKDFSAPLLKVTKDSCNVISYYAYKDDRRVDGAYNEINVLDTSKANCPNMKFAGPTILKFTRKIYDRASGKEIINNGSALGTKL